MGRIAEMTKRIVLPRFFQECDGFLTIGDNNEDYYRHYGVPDAKMHRGAFPIDVGRFRDSIRPPSVLRTIDAGCGAVKGACTGRSHRCPVRGQADRHQAFDRSILWKRLPDFEARHRASRGRS